MLLKPVITAVEKISRLQAGQMHELHGRYYDHVERKRFLRDLAEKEYTILLMDPRGRIAGFSTLLTIRLHVDGATHWFLFSGDTVVDESCRMSPALAGSFGHVLLRLMNQHGEQHLHWFLISKGFRTYRFLPVFFRRFFPSYDHPTPDEVSRLLEAVARHKFGGRYDSAASIIRASGQGDCLRAEFAGIPLNRLRDPHIAFFATRNPRYRQGDELACLTDITKANLNTFAWRVIKQTNVEWNE